MSKLSGLGVRIRAVAVRESAIVFIREIEQCGIAVGFDNLLINEQSRRRIVSVSSMSGLLVAAPVFNELTCESGL